MLRVSSPPSPVVWGLARLLQGARPEEVPLEQWSEPWQSMGRNVAGANGSRQEVLRECLQRECGDEQADSVTRSIFAIDPSEPAPHEAPWELPLAFDTQALPPFPVDAFPAWLQRFVEAEAEATQTPVDMPAMMALSMLSLALARKAVVVAMKGWIEPLNVWTITTMEPANRKSAVVRDLMEPIVAYQREEASRLAPVIREAQSRLKVLELRAERMRALAAKARPEESMRLIEEATRVTEEAARTRVPASPKLWTDDCTPEMMATLLSEHNGRMAVVSAEGNILELMAGRYSKGRPNIGVYLAGHAGDAYTVDRRGRPSEYIPHPAITVGITIQKEVLRSMARQPGFRGCGLLARFLYCYPQSRLGMRKSNPEPVASWIVDNYTRHLRSMLELPFATDERGEPSTHVVRLSDEARAQLLAFQEVLEPQLSPYGELGAINDWAGKLCGAVVRVAGLLHAADQAPLHTPWDSPVSLETMQRAVRIGEYLVEHARAAFSEMSDDPQSEDADFILGWVRRRPAPGSFNERELYQAVKGRARYKRMESLRAPLDQLVERGILRRRPPAREGPGRRPAAVYDINPAMLASRPLDPTE